MARKQFKRRRLARKHPVMRAVAKQVVKTALRSTIERKRFNILPLDLSMGATTYYHINPMQAIVEGIEDFRRIGDKISNVTLNMGLMYYHVGTAPLGAQLWQGSKLRVLIVKSRRQLTPATSVTNWKDEDPISGQLPGLFINAFQSSSSPIDTHNYTVLYDKLLSPSSTPNGGGNFGIPVVHRFSKVLAKSFRFTEGTQFGKFSNIYVIVSASGVTGGNADTIGRLQTASTISWSDA